MFDNLAKFDLKYIYFLLGVGERGRGGGGGGTCITALRISFLIQNCVFSYHNNNRTIGNNYLTK